ncbi:hypothetical protein [Priestia megaterium]|uniref:hypothetical protein n=1 Tax=Priestia megaterium TaxID=1404 RepID=UPI000CA2E9D8|nr:hypothetical protein [Priestia megaterium]AUO14805.1 hypothetical protein C0569_26340 [Priestia megaterium]
MDKNISLYCDADETGKITRMLSGERIIPVSQYRYFFKIDRKQEANLDKYRVENGQLVQIEGTTLIEVENPNPSTEEQLADVKKQLAAMQEKDITTQAILAQVLELLNKQPEEETPTVPEETPTETPEEPTN